MGFLKEAGSHSSAAVAGYAFVPRDADVLLLNWIDAEAQFRHRSGQVRPKPVKRPWEQKTPTPRMPVVPDVESTRRRDALKERFGLRM